MKDREPIRKVDSKTFRAVVARASLVATMVSACARPGQSPYVPSETSLPTPTEVIPTHTPFSTPTEDPTLATDQAVSEILSSIAEEYGIEIPAETTTEFSGRDGQNSPLSLEEAQIVAEVLDLVPNIGKIIQLVIPVRNPDEGAIPGGSYLGYQWPFFLHPEEYEEFPRDRFLSDRRAVLLRLPDGASVFDPLPQIRPDSTLLTPLLQITYNSTEVELKQEMEIPWSTNGERLKQAILHEIGHGLLSWASLSASPTVEEYWEKQAYTLYGWNTRDIENPLLVEFAHVNGWRLIPYSEYVSQFSLDKARRLLEEYPSTRDTLVWDRDPTVWGGIEDRVIRLNPYASYGPIQEAFSEFWMVSILYPELLTEEELNFFEGVMKALQEGTFPGYLVSN